MRGDRYAILGLAPARAGWFTDVARWATGALVPVELQTCLTIDEVHAHLAGGRAFSALLLDASTPGLDRDLVTAAARSGIAVLIVTDGTNPTDRRLVEPAAVLSVPFDPPALLHALSEHCAPIGAPGELRLLHRDAPPDTPTPGHLLAVCGAGGTGTSVAAQALARGLALEVGSSGGVLLADLALDADQAMLHAAGDVLPGLQELLEAVRRGELGPQELDSLLFSGEHYPYRLLLGLRRHRDWALLRPRAVADALATLRHHHRYVVADVDSDVEGERSCGSVDVEERNLLARTATADASVVVVTGHAGVQGVHRLVRVLAGLLDHGVDPSRLLPVVMRAPRSPSARAAITRAVAELLAPALPADAAGAASPLPLPHLRRLDRDLWDAVGPPEPLSRPLTGAVLALLDRLGGPPAARDDTPLAVAPGSLGHWTRQDALG